MAKAVPLPVLTLNEQELIGTYSEQMPMVMDMLQSFHPETQITGDDLNSFFGLSQAVRVGDRTSKRLDDGTIDPDGVYDRDAHVRALNNLTRSLWADSRAHQHADALRHARHALRLDPYDRAGTRLLLMAWEAASGNWPAARRLTLRYRREPRTEIRYWLALHAFRDGSSDADTLLATAIVTNPHVVPALQGRLRALHQAERSYAFGPPEEATHYAADARDGWKATRGALAWLTTTEH